MFDTETARYNRYNRRNLSVAAKHAPLDVEDVSQLVEQFGGYRPLARWLGNEAWNAQLWRIVNEPGFMPSAELRAALGQPLKPRHIVVTQPCPCGDVHVRATCKQGRVLARRRRSAEPAFLRFVQEVTVPFLEECRQASTKGAKT